MELNLEKMQTQSSHQVDAALEWKVTVYKHEQASDYNRKHFKINQTDHKQPQSPLVCVVNELSHHSSNIIYR